MILAVEVLDQQGVSERRRGVNILKGQPDLTGIDPTQQPAQASHIESLLDVLSAHLCNDRVVISPTRRFKQLLGKMVLQPQGNPLALTDPRYLQRADGGVPKCAAR